MATFNLIRNSRLFFSTNVNTAGTFLEGTPCTAANSYELTVLDGFSFSQTTNSDTIAIAEAGGSAVRGQRTFNTSLNPVDFSFSTYIRPSLSTTVKAEEAPLWNALFNNVAHTTSGTTLGANATTAVYTAGTGQLVIGGTAMNVLTVGTVYNVKGITGVNNANQFNTMARVLASTSTSLTLQYLIAPPATTFSTPATNIPTGVTFNTANWVEHVAVGADTAVPTAYSEVNTGRSNQNQLLAFAIVVTVDGVSYALDNCVLDQASIDFGLDGIATIAWTGKAATIRQLTTNISYAAPSGGTVTITGGATGVITQRNTSTKYITNKLATITLAQQIGGGGTAYTLALTGGSITISNNVNYITPSNLGVVNTPIGYYTGARSVTGTINAYLRTGTGNTADLFSTMVAAAANSAETKFAIAISIGGAANPVKVELYGVGASLQIPTIDAQAVMSTAIQFTLQGTDPVGGATAQYDIESTNDLRIRYFSN